MDMPGTNATWRQLCTALLFALLVSGCATKQQQQPALPPYGRGSLVLPNGVSLEDSRFIALALDADYILIGERHDNAVDHATQARILRLLAEAGRSPLLGLEMLPRNRYDTILARFSKNRLTLEDLPEKLDWQHTWGFDFALYKPVFAVAGEFGIPVHGLNIPNEVRQAVSRKGLNGLTPKERRELPRDIIPPLPEQREMLADFFRRHTEAIHGGKAPASSSGAGPQAVPVATGVNPLVMPVAVPAVKSGTPATVTLPLSLQRPFERFLLIQSLWDSTMAEQAILAREKAARLAPGTSRPMVILAGVGHVERGFGIAHRLSRLAPGSCVLSVMPFSEERPEPEEANIFYYSPVRPRLGILFAQQGETLAVRSVMPGSRAEKAGLTAGDVIVSSRGAPIRRPADLHAAAMAAGQSGAPLELIIRRQGKEQVLRVE